MEATTRFIPGMDRLGDAPAHQGQPPLTATAA